MERFYARLGFILPGIVLCLVLISGLLVPTSARAIDIFQNACGTGGAGNSSLCQERDKANKNNANPLTGPNGIIRQAAGLVAAATGVAAVIVLVYAGFTFVISNGEPSKTKAAQSMVLYTLVGLMVVVLAESIVSLVLSRLK